MKREEMMNRGELHTPHADLKTWKNKHPRASKHYASFFVDFDSEGSKTKVVNYSWTACRHLVLQRDKQACRVCGSDGREQRRNDYGGSCCHRGLEVHYIVPRSQRGTNHPANLITLCRKCHLKTFKHKYAGVPGVPKGNQKILEGIF